MIEPQHSRAVPLRARSSTADHLNMEPRNAGDVRVGSAPLFITSVVVRTSILAGTGGVRPEGHYIPDTAYPCYGEFEPRKGQDADGWLCLVADATRRLRLIHSNYLLIEEEGPERRALTHVLVSPDHEATNPPKGDWSPRVAYPIRRVSYDANVWTLAILFELIDDSRRLRRVHYRHVRVPEGE